MATGLLYWRYLNILKMPFFENFYLVKQWNGAPALLVFALNRTEWTFFELLSQLFYYAEGGGADGIVPGNLEPSAIQRVGPCVVL